MKYIPVLLVVTVVILTGVLIVSGAFNRDYCIHQMVSTPDAFGAVIQSPNDIYQCFDNQHDAVRFATGGQLVIAPNIPNNAVFPTFDAYLRAQTTQRQQTLTAQPLPTNSYRFDPQNPLPTGTPSS
ncbi:MAG: hypothetical protein SF029_10185 [bacterium]|nr:hypothetical protein [bacterium]